MDAYQLKAPNKINLKAFQLVTKGAVGNEQHYDSRAPFGARGIEAYCQKGLAHGIERVKEIYNNAMGLTDHQKVVVKLKKVRQFSRTWALDLQQY